ncbi:hypothetical protein [Pseudonocardia lacus]|uniref:hypothetical protein n=1 Tax=Pseudonocardia lacus TaxID=2835865 RepID=UPI001BDCD17E|nr:hypothetical protein [Pseudonocardia lacus]
MPTEDSRNRIEEAAAIVAGWPNVWGGLLVVHRAGPDGRCTECTRANRLAPRWPCGPAVLALRARRMARTPTPVENEVVVIERPE